MNPFIYEFPKAYKDKNLEDEKKLLQRLDKDLRSINPLISQVVFSVTGNQKKVQIANSEGLLSFDSRPYRLFKVMSIAEDQGEKENGFASEGFTGTQSFSSEDSLRDLTIKSGKMAVKNLKAEPAPSGVFPVIINNGFGGVIFHEACGHGLETFSVTEKRSVFSDKLGRKNI